MKKYVRDLLILEKYGINDEYFVLELTDSDFLPDILPAQFVEVLVENAPGVFLRRPISIHDVDYEKNTLKLLIQIVGEGTRRLSLLQPGDSVNLIFPLGNTFSMPDSPKILLVGGGCGMAPLLYTARHFHDYGFELKVLMGARSKSGLLLRDEYRKYGELLTCTEDGSHGVKGYVTDHPVFQPENIDVIYACGPTPMIKALGNWALSHQVECEVSLENMMACGIGACLCCVQKTNSGNKTVCQDGPVFNIKDIVWQT